MTSKQKIAWVIEVGEPLPVDGKQVRLMRAGIIARTFSSQGWKTTWWTSSFNHADKQHMAKAGDVTTVLNDVDLRFVHGRAYKKNISMARVLNHLEEAKDFARRARQMPKPDVIVCGYPTIDLAYEAVRYGKEFGVPVIIDVRDLWPEVFLDVSPLPEFLTRLALAPLYRKAKQALSGATAIIAITEPFLEKALKLAGRGRNSEDMVVPLAYKRNVSTPHAKQSALDFWREKGLKLDGSERIVCCFGNLSDVPEFETAIDSLEHLTVPQKKDFRMVICGRGEKLKWLHDQSKNHPSLVVPGFVGQAEIATLMDFSHLGMLIYPNRKDFIVSYPNKVGEYLSRGLPIISTLDGLTGTLIVSENIGVVTPSQNAKAFATTLKEVLGDDERRDEMSKNAMRVFNETFDASKVYSELVRSLERLAIR